MTTATATPVPTRRRHALLVALLTAVSAGLFLAHLAVSSDTFQHCTYLGPSTRMYVTAWTGPLSSVAAMGLYTRLLRNARGHGLMAGQGPRAWLATTSAALALLLLCVQLPALYWVYAPDPAGGYDCSGLHLPLP
ncbi:hypothetical protein [Streptomyces sp. NPDC048665]|uniref:hypothetical protein n=1 Tax=Streptomyces sp. NPDC048665 TaxID=3155490 RepID=UPI00343F98DE